MADLSDVESSLVGALATVLFPTIVYLPGDYQPSAAVAVPPGGGSAAPIFVHLYRGWPEQTALVADLAAGRAHVSIYPLPGMAADTTRYARSWTVISAPAPTLTATVAGRVVTFGGTGGAGQVAGVTFGLGISTPAYAYRLGANDSPATVAAALAAAIPTATAAGAALTLPSAPAVARVVADATAIQEVARQTQVFAISIWAPTPAARDALGAMLTQAIAEPRCLALPDGSVTDILKYRGTWINDMPARDRLWRRDIRCSTEYPTTLTQTQTPALFPEMALNGVITVPTVFA